MSRMDGKKTHTHTHHARVFRVCKYRTSSWHLNRYHAQSPILPQHNHYNFFFYHFKKIVLMSIIVTSNHTRARAWVNSKLLLFLTFSALLVANLKKDLYMVANPARGLMNRGGKKREKNVAAHPPHPPPPPPPPARCSFEENRNKNHATHPHV